MVDAVYHGAAWARRPLDLQRKKGIAKNKGSVFYAEIYRQKTAFVSHDVILRILHNLHSDEMSSRLFCGNESDAAFAGSGCKVL